MEEYIDINYNGRVKDKYNIDEIYKKINNYIKTYKINFICEKENNNICIKFKDDISDDFVLDLNKNKFSGYCRVGCDEKEGENSLEKLLDILFSIKMVFSKIELEDDYSICKSYWNNKKIKIVLLEITEEEETMIKNIYDNGTKNYRRFIIEYLAKSINCNSYKELYINSNAVEEKWHIDLNEESLNEEMCERVFETWLYETTEYKKSRFYLNEFFNKDNIVEYMALNAVAFDMVAFVYGILRIISNDWDKDRWRSSFGVRDGQVKRFYRGKIVPLLEEYKNNSWEQCVIAYRYLKSILQYTNFQFVGKDSKTENDKKYRQVKFKEQLKSNVQEAFEYFFNL